VHSSMFVQDVPSPEKPALHAHVKEPTVSVHAALVSQLDSSAIEGRGPSALQSSPSVTGPFSIQLRQHQVLKVLGAGQVTTAGPRAPRTASLPSPGKHRSRYRMLNDTGIDCFVVYPLGPLGCFVLPA